MADFIEEKSSDEKLGAYLRRVRESSGLSLDDLSQKTRISIANLQNIEDGEWKFFTVEAYVRGYLNSISEALGLDAEKILSAYSAEAGSSYSKLYQAPDTAVSNPAFSTEKASSGKGAKIAILVVIILAIAFFVAMNFLKDFEISAPLSPSTPPQQVTLPVEDSSAFEVEMPEGAENVSPDSIKPNEDSSAVKEPLDSASVQKANGKASSATTFIKSSDSRMSSASVDSVVESEGRINFLIKGNDAATSWVGLYRSLDDMKVLKEANISTSKSRMSFSYDDTLCVVIGNPDAVGQLLINGKGKQVPIRKGYASRFCIAPNGKFTRR